MRSIALLVATAALVGCLHIAEEQESVRPSGEIASPMWSSDWTTARAIR